MNRLTHAGPGGAPATEALRDRARALRRLIIDVSHASRVGHIGSALSIADIMVTLWHRTMHAPGTDESTRDRFVLGKGHAALALYGCLYQRGLMTRDALYGFCRGGVGLCAHPLHTSPGVDASTGSLGQGLSIACGMALAMRRARRSGRVFALVSDAECNEGQLWEAVMFAGHHRLDRLHVVVDCNGSQCLGETSGILAGATAPDAWSAFGWNVRACDGHDVAGLASTLGVGDTQRPTVVHARTVIGKGVDWMEGDFRSHYHKLSATEHAAALRDLDQ